MKYTKETHIELSNGDTNIVSYKDCPMSEEEITNMGNSAQVTKEKLVPCCNCQAWIDGTRDVNCSYYFGIILSEDKGLKIHCQHPNMKKQGKYEEVKK